MLLYSGSVFSKFNRVLWEIFSVKLKCYTQDVDKSLSQEEAVQSPENAITITMHSCRYSRPTVGAALALAPDTEPTEPGSRKLAVVPEPAVATAVGISLLPSAMPTIAVMWVTGPNTYRGIERFCPT